MSKSNTRSFTTLIICAVLGTVMAVAGSNTGLTFDGRPIFAMCVALAFLINGLAFIPANAAQSEKYYDLTGSLTYISMILFAVFTAGQFHLRAVLAALMVILWAGRLGTFLFTRISRDGHDGRFDDIKIRPLRFFSAWMLQGLWTVMTAACALVIITSGDDTPLGWIGWTGVILWLIGFAVEVIADNQKSAFKANPNNKGQFITEGLWARSQHPNYFGEILLWIGMAVMALPILSGGQWVALISPVFVFLLLTKVSGIPLLQKRAKERWGDDPAFQAYQARTPLLFPRLF